MSWTPCVETETSRGIREVNLRTKDLMAGTIYLTGMIDTGTALDFLSQLRYLENAAKNTGPGKRNAPFDEVTVIINSPGGEVGAGFLIYDVMQAATVPIRVICAGIAASMAAVILSGGTKGRRFILPHSEVIIHEPQISGVGANTTTLNKLASDMMIVRDRLNEVLAKHTGQTEKRLRNILKEDYRMDAEAAVEFGIVDSVLTDMI